MTENFSSYRFSLVMGKREIQKEFIRNFGFDFNKNGSKNKRKSDLKIW